jgi:hypothetical protein
MQHAFVDSDVTTEDDESQADEDEVTCSLADWRTDAGITSDLRLDERPVDRALPEPRGLLQPPPDSLLSGRIFKHVQVETHKRLETGSQSEQGRKRRKVEGGKGQGEGAFAAGVFASRSGQTEPEKWSQKPLENPPSTRPSDRSMVDVGGAQAGTAVSVTAAAIGWREGLAAGVKIEGGPQPVFPASEHSGGAGRLSGGTSPIPTPVIAFFDRVMGEREDAQRAARVRTDRGVIEAGQEREGVLLRDGVGDLLDGGIAGDTENRFNQGVAPVHDNGGENLVQRVGVKASGDFRFGAQTEAVQLEVVTETRKTSVGPEIGAKRRESLTSPGDDFWNEALALAAAAESQKQQGMAAVQELNPLEDRVEEAGEFRGLAGGPSAEGWRFPLRLGEGNPVEELGGRGLADREEREGPRSGGEVRGVYSLQVDRSAPNDDPESSQSPLPVRHIAFTPPEVGPMETAAIPRPPVPESPRKNSFQQAALKQARNSSTSDVLPQGPQIDGASKDALAAAAAAALLAPGVGLPKQLNHSLSKAPTPLNSLATCELHTGPSLGLTLPSLAEGVHDTIEESESHAEDSISQFETQAETQPESGPEDGGDLPEVNRQREGILAFGAVQIARAEQGVCLPSEGEAGMGLEPQPHDVRWPFEQTTVFADAAPRASVELDNAGCAFAERMGGFGEHFLEGRQNDAILEAPRMFTPVVGAFPAEALQERDAPAAWRLAQPQLINQDALEQSSHRLPMKRLGEGPFLQAADLSAGESASQAQKRPGGVGLVQAEIQKRDAFGSQARLRSGSQAGKQPLGESSGSQVRSGANSAGVLPQAADIAPVEQLDGAAQPLGETEDPIECSLGSQPNSQEEGAAPREAPRLHPSRNDRLPSQKHGREPGPFTPLSSPFSPRPPQADGTAARTGPQEAGPSHLSTGGTPANQPLGTPAQSANAVSTPAQPGVQLHQEGGTPTQGLSMATPVGSRGRPSEGGESGTASCELSTYLPAGVCAVYSSKGVSKMYQWQVRNHTIVTGRSFPLFLGTLSAFILRVPRIGSP